MIFVINNLKYDTDKMELISENCKYKYKWKSLFFDMLMESPTNDVKLFRSKKNNWILTYQTNYQQIGKAIDETEAKELLLKYDVEKYEELFGELEEA